MSLAVRLFLSSMIFAIAIAAGYAIATRDLVGTLLLGTMAIAMIVVSVYIVVAEKESDLACDVPDAKSEDLAGESLGSFTLESYWPILGAAATTLLLLGVVFLPGGVGDRFAPRRGAALLLDPLPRAREHVNGTRSSRELALRTHPLVFGVVVFLASDLMFFGSLIAAYFNLRATDTPWPPTGVTLDTVESSVGTAFLAASSGTMLLTTHFLAAGRTALARLWLGATLLLGTAFELIAVHGWILAPFRIDTHAYGTVYFAMTGFHFLHVAAGIVMLGILFAGIRMAAFERDRRAAVEAIGFYWHFVFAVWVLIWGTIYFVR